MVDENTVQPAPIAESLRDEFREAVKEYHGGIRNYYRTEMENALEERIKVLRGEESSTSDVSNKELLTRLDEMGGTLSQIAAERAQPNSKSDVQRKVEAVSTATRAEARQRGNPFVDVEVVNREIRDIAGTSPKTIKKYRTLLREQRELYPHPAKQRSAWYVEPEALIVSVERELSAGRVYQILDGSYYPYDEDWWETHAPDGFFDDDDNREVGS